MKYALFSLIDRILSPYYYRVPFKKKFKIKFKWFKMKNGYKYL